MRRALSCLLAFSLVFGSFSSEVITVAKAEMTSVVETLTLSNTDANTPPVDDTTGKTPAETLPPVDDTTGKTPAETLPPVDDTTGKTPAETLPPVDDTTGKTPAETLPPVDDTTGKTPAETLPPPSDSTGTTTPAPGTPPVGGIDTVAPPANGMSSHKPARPQITLVGEELVNITENSVEWDDNEFDIDIEFTLKEGVKLTAILVDDVPQNLNKILEEDNEGDLEFSVAKHTQEVVVTFLSDATEDEDKEEGKQYYETIQVGEEFTIHAQYNKNRPYLLEGDSVSVTEDNNALLVTGLAEGESTVTIYKHKANSPDNDPHEIQAVYHFTVTPAEQLPPVAEEHNETITVEESKDFVLSSGVRTFVHSGGQFLQSNFSAETKTLSVTGTLAGTTVIHVFSETDTLLHIYNITVEPKAETSVTARYYVLLPNQEVPQSGDTENIERYVPNDTISVGGYGRETGIPGQITSSMYSQIPNDLNERRNYSGFGSDAIIPPATLGSYSYEGVTRDLDQYDIVWYKISNQGDKTQGGKYINVDGYAQNEEVQVVYRNETTGIDIAHGNNVVLTGREISLYTAEEIINANPNFIPDGYRLKGWNINGVSYALGDSFLVMTSEVVTPVLEEIRGSLTYEVKGMDTKHPDYQKVQQIIAELPKSAPVGTEIQTLLADKLNTTVFNVLEAHDFVQYTSNETTISENGNKVSISFAQKGYVAVTAVVLNEGKPLYIDYSSYYQQIYKNSKWSYKFNGTVLDSNSQQAFVDELLKKVEQNYLINVSHTTVDVRDYEKGTIVQKDLSQINDYTVTENIVISVVLVGDAVAKEPVTVSYMSGEKAIKHPGTWYKSQTIPLFSETTAIENGFESMAGHKFLGWNTEKNATTVEYQGGADLTLTGDVVLYPVYEKLEYNIGYKHNLTNLPEDLKITNIPQNSKNKFGDNIYPIAIPAATYGYRFAGWIYEDTQQNVSSNDLQPAKDVVLIANFVPEEYAIQYFEGETSIGNLTPKYYTYGTGVAELPALENTLTRKFLGWTNGITEDYITSITAQHYGAVSLYAKTSLVQYNMTYAYAGVQEADLNKFVKMPDVKLVDNGSQVTLPVEVTNQQVPGYKFLGWKMTSKDGTDVDVTTSVTMPTQDVTLTAVYEGAKTLTVNYWQLSREENVAPTALGSYTLNNLYAKDTVGQQDNTVIENAKHISTNYLKPNGYVLKEITATSTEAVISNPYTVGDSSDTINVYYAYDDGLWKAATVEHIYNSNRAIAGTKSESTSLIALGSKFTPVVQNKFQGVNYVLSKREVYTGDNLVDTDANELEMTKDGVKVVYTYDVDSIGSGDGIADKYQVVFTYSSIAEDQGTLEGTLYEVVNKSTVVNGETVYNENMEVSPKANIVTNADRSYIFSVFKDAKGISYYSTSSLANAKFTSDMQFSAYWARRSGGGGGTTTPGGGGTTTPGGGGTTTPGSGGTTTTPSTTVPDEPVPLGPPTTFDNTPIYVAPPVVEDNTPAVEPQPPIVNIDDEEVPLGPGTVTIDDEEVPLGFKPVGAQPAANGWSLINLLLTLYSVLLGGYMTLKLFKPRKENEKVTQDQETIIKRNRRVRLTELAMSILCALTFIFTQSLIGQMYMVDMWTVVFAATAVVQTVSVKLVEDEKEQKAATTM